MTHDDIVSFVKTHREKHPFMPYHRLLQLFNADIDIQAFIKISQDEFPYCGLKTTRHKIYIRWIFVADSLWEMHKIIYKVPSSGPEYNRALAQITQGKAIPLTNDMSEVMDFMEYVGHGISEIWFGEVLLVISHFLALDTHIPLTRKKLFFECLKVRVYRFHYPSLDEDFPLLYKKNSSFRFLAFATETYMRDSHVRDAYTQERINAT